MKADAATEKEVLDVFFKYIDAYTNQDIEGVLEHFAGDEDVLVYGTGTDEKRRGLEEIRQQLERDFSQLKRSKVHFTWHTVSAAGSVAWLTTEFTASYVVNNREMSFALRQTAVFEKRKGTWHIMHSHISMPISERDEGRPIVV